MYACLFSLLTFLAMQPLLWGEQTSDLWQKANASYQQGINATSYQERKTAFNQALLLYQKLKQEDLQSADLDQALGDTYFQLGEYAWTILYYQKALKNGSVNALLPAHLKQAEEKLGLPPLEQKESQIQPFFALAQNTSLLLIAIGVTFLVISCTIWLSFSWLRKLAIGCAIVLSFLLGNALFFYYFSPLEGVLIKTTGLYRAPDWNQPQLTNQPLLAGSKVQILQMTKEDNWLKIEYAGTIGYIPTDHLRPI